MAGALVEVVRYHAWANRCLIDACAALTAEQLELTASGTYGPIWTTLGHLVGSELYYLFALTGRWLTEPLREGERYELAELRERAERTAEGLEEAAARVRPTRMLRLRRAGEERRIPAVAMVIQVLHHGAEHRAQVATILGAHGIRPPNLSGWAYGERLKLVPPQ